MASNLLNVIKKASIDAFSASSPVTVCEGVVVKLEPLSIKISEQELTLDSDFFVFTKNVAKVEKGDRLLLLRKQGGQVFYCVGKI